MSFRYEFFKNLRLNEMEPQVRLHPERFLVAGVVSVSDHYSDDDCVDNPEQDS